jgi:hypothetical protein
VAAATWPSTRSRASATRVQTSEFTLGQRREIKKIAKSKPGEHDLPFSAWSLSKLAQFLVAEVPYL